VVGLLTWVEEEKRRRSSSPSPPDPAISGSPLDVLPTQEQERRRQSSSLSPPLLDPAIVIHPTGQEQEKRHNSSSSSPTIVAIASDPLTDLSPRTEAQFCQAEAVPLCNADIAVNHSQECSAEAAVETQLSTSSKHHIDRHQIDEDP
jgi:hypothetical protein